jgi:hypothetical protein
MAAMLHAGGRKFQMKEVNVTRWSLTHLISQSNCHMPNKGQVCRPSVTIFLHIFPVLRLTDPVFAPPVGQE